MPIMDTSLVYSYQFNFPDKASIEITLDIDPVTIVLKNSSVMDLPAWTVLTFKQCSNCPLNVNESPNCPVAENLIPLLVLSSSLVSYDVVNVVIHTSERIITANTTIQRAVSSLLGLIMATSPCPHTEFLKPMARFHLPLASDEETIYRTTSMYMLAQYFKAQDRAKYELGFSGLTNIYANLKIINRALADRLRAATQEDATVNAIILLDLLSQAVTWSIEDKLEELESLFIRFSQ